MSNNKLKGNAHSSRRKIRKALEEIADSSSRAFEALHHLKLKGIRPEEFIGGLGLDRWATAYEAGIFDLPENNFFNGEIPENFLDKIVAHANYANRSNGHRYNVYRKRQEPRNRKRRAGGGFSFKPEIPYQPPPVSTSHILRRIREWNESEIPLEIKRMYEDGIDSSLAEQHPLDSDYRYRQRYDRKNHPEQSMPKIEWHAVRRWKNRPIPTPNNKRRAMYNTTRESKDVRERMEGIREEIGANPRSAFGRDREGSRFTSWGTHRYSVSMRHSLYK